jgi:S1-C subfamily serine protease
MKNFILFFMVTSHAFSRSIVPERIKTPPLQISRAKQVQPGVFSVPSLGYFQDGDFKLSGKKVILGRDEFERFQKLSRAVLEMIPDDGGRNQNAEQRRGTAFHIGNNLVLTNHHVLDENMSNTSECADFSLQDEFSNKFECKKVHFCSIEHDICLIEMKNKFKRVSACLFCSGEKVDISLALKASLKIRADFRLPEEKWDQHIVTAIGNPMGWGIHLSQGIGLKQTPQNTYFWAPITKGNSGGPLLNDNDEVIGVIKRQSRKTIGEQTSLTYNLATPSTLVIQLIQEALEVSDPEILTKFKQAVIE